MRTRELVLRKSEKRRRKNSTDRALFHHSQPVRFPSIEVCVGSDAPQFGLLCKTKLYQRPPADFRGFIFHYSMSLPPTPVPALPLLVFLPLCMQKYTPLYGYVHFPPAPPFYGTSPFRLRV